MEGHRRTQPRKQVVDRRRVADRIGFEREAVPRRHPRREAQRRHRDVLNAAAAVIDELEPGLPQRIQVVDPVVGRIGGQRGLLEDGGREQTLERFDGGARAADVHVERAVRLRIDVDDLEGRVVRPLPELAVHPFDTVLRVVLGVGEEIVQRAPADRFHDAVRAPALGAAKVRAETGGERLETGLVHGCGHVRQMGALAPGGQRLRIKEARGAPPAGGMVEERRHGARAMMRQRGELLDEGRVGRRVGREVPRRVVEDGAVAFLATQGRDVPKRGVHRVTLGVVQRQPDRAQRVGLGLRQRGNVEIGEDAAGVEIAGQQTVRHLPEEVAGGVVARHRLSARPTRASRRTAVRRRTP